MISKEQYWQSLAHELIVIRHLATKVPKGQEHHKPTEKQRTTLELMQFIASFGGATFKYIMDGNREWYTKAHEGSKSVTMENFAAAIEQEEMDMKEIFMKITDAQLEEEVEGWGRKQSRDMFFLDFLKMIAAYKMQLFLYAKQSGNYDIGTSNVWGGMDMPPKKA